MHNRPHALLLFARFEGDNQPQAEKYKRDARKAPNFSGPLMLPNRASANSLSAPIRSSGGNRTYKTSGKCCIFYFLNNLAQWFCPLWEQIMIEF